MRILCIGDIVSEAGMQKIKKNLSSLIKEFSIDYVIANGENANKNNGISREDAEELHFCGVDIITTGNHVFRQKNIYNFLDDSNYIIRPANYAPDAPGRGFTVQETSHGTICIINLIGQIYLNNSTDNPFRAVDRILKDIKADMYFVDFHAEATSEKRAMGFWLDGRVDCVFGTHTHVQTADEQILPNGTAYITDVGMTGAIDSVLGVEKEIIIKKFTTNISTAHRQALSQAVLCAIIVDTNKKTIERINR